MEAVAREALISMFEKTICHGPMTLKSTTTGETIVTWRVISCSTYVKKGTTVTIVGISEVNNEL